MSSLNAGGGQITLAGRPVHLKGLNIGGWLMPEGYFTHAPNRAYHLFRKEFVRACGPAAIADLERNFRRTFICEDDLARIAAMGFNCVRLPFHHALVEETPYVYSHEGLRYLDDALRWAGKHGLWVILDLHAAPGGQNHDWHCDSDGKARLWMNRNFRLRTCALWAFLADRYRSHPALAGYDIINEPVLDDTALLNAFYHQAIKAIRTADRDHIIFVEGNRWSQDLACLDAFDDDNLAFSFHFYVPLEFTFNFVPGQRYADMDRAPLARIIDDTLAVARRAKRALWCGEFGVNGRDGLYGEDRWLADTLRHFNAAGIHWTYWTWKAVKNSIFPDGIMSYRPNPPWVNRPGPLTGWETWHEHWLERRREMVASWKTTAFTENRTIADALKSAAR